MIDCFDGRFAFLSNFASSEVVFEGVVFPTIEHAFQAAKTLDIGKRREIATLATPGLAKREGRRVRLRSDWEQVKDQVMLDLLRQKFHTTPLKELLDKTNSEILIEGNFWHDNYWGDCRCANCRAIPGKNTLGRLLMTVREENRK